MNKRIISILLALLLTAPALFSCGTSETATETTADTIAPETETEKLYPVYNMTFDGADFNIVFYDAVKACAWGNTIPCDIAVEELTGDALSDAVYNRNAAMEELKQSITNPKRKLMIRTIRDGAGKIICSVS